MAGDVTQTHREGNDLTSFSGLVSQELWEKTGLLLSEEQKQIIQANYDFCLSEHKWIGTKR